MEQLWTIHNIIEKLKEDRENQSCFDCGTTDPVWASANNGILLCLKCSGLHRGLGVNISLVKSIELDQWQETEVKQMHYGGNSSLQDFLTVYSLDKSTDIYKTKALVYYRKTLKARADNQNIEEIAPDIETGKQIDEELQRQGELLAANNEERFLERLEKIWQEAKEFSRSFSSKIKDLTVEDIKSKSKSFFQELSEKVGNYDYKGKLAELKEKSKEIYHNVKESTQYTIDHPRESFKEKYESSKNSVIETYEKSKAKVLETYESSKEIIKENYHSSVERIQGSGIIQRARSMLN